MKITWLGHSCFKIEKDGYTIITDPYEDGSVPGLGNVRGFTNKVLKSHDHHDHNAAYNLRTVRAEAEPPIITMIDTFHDDVKGAKRGKNRIHIMEFEDEKIAHFGDLGCDLTPEEEEQLKRLDVVMIPVGGYYTIDGKQAADIIKRINPKIVIPMHFKDENAGFGYDVISTVDEFVNECGRKLITPGDTLDTKECEDGTVAVLVPKLINK
jgi:L-ascorbate metabolism protein UlaG (beta-lactamase superfamily)